MDNSEAGILLRTLRVMASDLYVDGAALGRAQVALADSGALLDAPRTALRNADRGSVGDPGLQASLSDFLEGWEHGFELIEQFATSASAFLQNVDDAFASLEAALTNACRGEP